MQDNDIATFIHHYTQPLPKSTDAEVLPVNAGTDTQKVALTAERARLRHGIIHVHIRHFYCSLEESFDPSLHGQPFVVGTGTGRPNEPGRVIDASPAAMRLGIIPGMPLRRVHRLAPRTRFLSAARNRYQPILQQLNERYHTYSRLMESVPIADAFIDLRGCELPFTSPVSLGERLCAEISEMGFTALTGIANGKAIAELAALMSRKDGRQGVLYVPSGREASFVQTLPLSILLQLRATSTGLPSSLPLLEQNEQLEVAYPRPVDMESKSEQVDTIAVSELVAHLKDFGITTFAQVAKLTEEGLHRRLGGLGAWLYHVAHGEDPSLVVPDTPPLSQNARMHFHLEADADQTCMAIRKLANHLGERLHEQHLKGKVVGILLWPSQDTAKETRMSKDTRKLILSDEGEEMAITAAEEALSGQIVLPRYTDEADVIAHYGLMLFAQYHQPATCYSHIQLRIGDILVTAREFYPPPARTRRRMVR